MVDGYVESQDSKIFQSRSGGGGVRGSDVYLKEFNRTIVVANYNSRFDTADIGFRQA